MADASPVTIEQISGPKRAMVFKGRALPYRPLEFSRTMRVETTWYPANPKASQQIIGSTFEPTTLTGTWKDDKLLTNNAANGVDLINFPPLALGARPQTQVSSGGSFTGTVAFPAAQPAQLARVVVDAITMMIAEGQDMRFSWDQFVRYGKITRFVFRPGEPTGGIGDIGWELELTWSGDVESPPVKRPVNFNLLAAASGLSTILAAILAVLQKLAKLANPNRFFQRISAALGAIVDLVAALIGVFRAAVSLASAPANFLSLIKGALQAIKLLGQQLLEDLRGIRSASGEAARIGDLTAVQIAALIQGELHRRLTELLVFATLQQRIAELFATDEILGTFFATNFTSLRDVAAQYYGDANQWPGISTYNGFYSQTVPRGTLVRVPRID